MTGHHPRGWLGEARVSHLGYREACSWLGRESHRHKEPRPGFHRQAEGYGVFSPTQGYRRPSDNLYWDMTSHPYPTCSFRSPV